MTKYLEYTRFQQSPELLHFWVGLTTLAATVNRKVWLARRSHGVTWYTIHPGRFMCILVTPPGKGRKGTAISSGRRLMEANGVHVLPGKGSAERIIRMLGAVPAQQTMAVAQQPDAIATFIAPELSVLLSKQTYAEGLIDFMTLAFDATEDKFRYSTQTGDVILKNLCVTFLGGATPISVGDSIPMKAQEHGFLGRFVYVWHNGNEKPTDALVDVDDSDMDHVEKGKRDQLERELVSGLTDISQVSGAFGYTLDGKKWFREWLMRWEQSPEGQGEGWPTRRPDYLLKVAMLLKLAIDHTSLLLDDAVLIAAHEALRAIEAGFPYAFACIGQSGNAAKYELILETLRKAGGQLDWPTVVHRLMRRFEDYQELRKATWTLKEAGLLVYVVKNQDEYLTLVPGAMKP